MLQNNSYFFNVKKWLSIFSVLTLLVTLMIASLYIPSYALRENGENCQPCHKSGITLSSNATEVIKVDPNTSFSLQVNAEGGNPDQMMLVWSNVSHNSLFTFTPNEVEDNDSNDRQSDGGKISVLYEISSPSTDGNYTLRTYAASNDGIGGFIEVEVTVGAGGVIAKPLLEIVMGWLTTIVPIILSGIAGLGIIIYIIAFRKIPRGVD